MILRWSVCNEQLLIKAPPFLVKILKYKHFK